MSTFKTFSTFDTLGFINAYESGECDEEQFIEGFQQLIHSGTITHLQGSYQRTAADLIAAGKCSVPLTVLMDMKDRGEQTFTFHSDPGHAWLEVSRADLAELGLTAASFSRYSYVGSEGEMYLEEDCDAGIFLTAFEAKRGKAAFTIRELVVDNDSFVRSLGQNSDGASHEAIMLAMEDIHRNTDNADGEVTELLEEGEAICAAMNGEVEQ